MVKKKIFFLIFLLSYSIFHGQNSYTISGAIFDSNQSPISNVNIIVKDFITQKIINYSTSSNSGSFNITFKNNNDKIIISFSAVGFKSNDEIVALISPKIILKDIVLKEDYFELKEIILQAKNNSGLIVKGDTTIYNIKKFINGTEQNLKDVLINLPGFKINSDGKIEHNGKVISELLIDGDNLYKNQHQLGTENIAANMIKTIELYKNHTPFDKLKNERPNNLTGLNIIIKDEYKNKVKGNVNLEYNFVNRKKISNYLYKFSNKNKFSQLFNSNNLGELPISLLDYFSLSTVEQEVTENNFQIKSFESLPNFLKSGENVAKKNNDFLNLSYVFSPNKKLKINLFSITNYSKQIEISEQKINFNNNLNFFENIINKENNLFLNSNFKIVFKPNTNTIYKNIINFNYENKSLNKIINSSINGISTINQSNKFDHLNLENNFEFSKKIKKGTLNTSLLFRNNVNNQNLEITSNNPFLIFNDANYNFEQYSLIKKRDLIFSSFYTFQLFKLDHTLKIKYKNIFFDFENNSSPSNFLNSIEFNQSVLSKEYNSFIIFFKKYKLVYGINSNLLFLNQVNFKNNSITFFGYHFGMDINFNKNSIFKINTQYVLNTTNVERLIENEFVKDYRTIVKTINLQPNTLFPENKITLNYLFTNPKNSNYFITNFVHTSRKKYEAENQITAVNYITLINNVGFRNEDTNFFVFTENSFLNNKLSITYNFDFNYSFRIFEVIGLNSFFKTNYFSNSIGIKSKYKKSFVHHTTGLSYSITNFNNNELKSKNTSFMPFLMLNGVFSKCFNWKINYSYNYFLVDSNNSEINILSLFFKYSKLKSKKEFYINAHNILNFDNAIFTSNQTSVGFTSIMNNLNLPGFINIGFRYNF